MRREPITDSSAWRGVDLQDSDEWRVPLEEGDLSEFDAALAEVRARGIGMTDIREVDFPLPTYGKKVEEMVHELERGRGFLVIEGLPVHDRYSEDEAQVIFWGIANHMGRIEHQNKRGDLLGHVIDKRNLDPTQRSYESNVAQPFHNDQCDVVALLCLRSARRGGESMIASSVEMHNVMLEEFPDQLPHLYDVYYADRKSEETGGLAPWYQTSVYTYHEGLLSGRFSTSYIVEAQRFPEVPRLLPEQLEAFKTIESIPRRDGMAISMKMEPGDMQFQNNYTTVHGRNGYEDHDDLDLRRHMVRLWITIKNGRTLSPSYGGGYTRDEPRAPFIP